MVFRMNLLSAGFWALTGLWMQPGAFQAQPPAQSLEWTLPHNTAVVVASPRTWRFTVVYNTAGPTGEIIQRQRITGDYTRGLPGNEVVWHNVTSATAPGAEAAFSAPEKQTYMEGFRYRNDVAPTFAPGFFKSFPPSAIMERNLVWDTGMFEMFGENHFDQLQLNVPLHSGPGGNLKLPDLGTFQNHDTVLEWVGRSQRNGQDCALIDYRAFFNPLDLATGGMTLKGRSDYWGQIWVSLATKQIEYATLYEEVFGQMKLPGQTAAQPLSVFRTGTFEPLPANDTGR